MAASIQPLIPRLAQHSTCCDVTGSSCLSRTSTARSPALVSCWRFVKAFQPLWVATVPTDKAPIEDRAVSEAEEAVLNLVRAMGEGDIVEGLGKLEMLEVLDDMRCDWMEILQHGLPELERGQAQARTPKLVKKCDF